MKKKPEPKTDVTGETWYDCPKCKKRKVSRKDELCIICMTEGKCENQPESGSA